MVVAICGLQSALRPIVGVRVALALPYHRAVAPGAAGQVGHSVVAPQPARPHRTNPESLAARTSGAARFEWWWCGLQHGRAPPAGIVSACSEWFVERQRAEAEEPKSSASGCGERCSSPSRRAPRWRRETSALSVAADSRVALSRPPPSHDPGLATTERLASRPRIVAPAFARAVRIRRHGALRSFFGVRLVHQTRREPRLSRRPARVA